MERFDRQGSDWLKDEVYRPRQPSKLARSISWATRHLDRAMLTGVKAFMELGIPRLSPDEALDYINEIGRFYGVEAVRQDPDRFFALPSIPHTRRHKASKSRDSEYVHLTWRTPHEPRHESYRDEFRKYRKIHTVHLYGWRHRKRRAPASLLLTHGWGGGNRHIHQFEFGVNYLHRKLGLDVYFYVAPFHWVRRPRASLFSGMLHPSPNLIRTNESFIQTIAELRQSLSVILQYNDAPVGVMGSSLGGYTSALLASLEDRLDFAIPILPPACLADLFWEQADGRVSEKLADMGLHREEFRRVWSLHSPLSWEPRVPWERRLIVSAIGDALVPEEQVRKLWEHWDRPERFEFAGSHLMQVGRHHYHREIGRFLESVGIL